jgi:hypothetical protein
MANEMFTTRSGKQIPVPTFSIPAHEVTSLMRLQEDYIQRGEHLSLLGVVLDVLDKGKRQVQNQWKNGDLSKNRRNFAKAVTVYMRDPAKYAAEIAQLARQHGLVNGTAVDLSETVEEPETEEITEDELEQATAPSKGAA